MINQVLVVDDVGYTRVLFERTLSHEGYEVTCVENGAEAIRYITNEQPSLVVLDINLPDISGMSILEEMRKRGRKTPVIMITARDTAEHKKQAAELGVFAFLPKPVDINDFLEVVADIFNPASRILIVDDEQLTLDLYQRFLTDEGYNVEVCEDGERAVTLLLNRSFDAVILDLNLPGKDGLEIIRTLREKGEDIPILVSTAYATISAEEQIRKYKIDGILEKPVNIELLIDIIRNLFGSIKQEKDEDITILELAGNVQNTTLLKSMIADEVKQGSKKFIFDLSQLTGLGSSVKATLLTLLGKEALICRLAAPANHSMNLTEHFPMTTIFENAITARNDIIRTIELEAARAEAMGYKPTEDEVLVEAKALDLVKGESYTIRTIAPSEVKVGMVLAEPVFNESGKVALVGESIRLNQEHVDKLLSLDYLLELKIKEKHKQNP